MEKDLDFIITRHDFKSVEDIRLALEEAYKAGEIASYLSFEQARWEAVSKLQ